MSLCSFGGRSLWLPGFAPLGVSRWAWFSSKVRDLTGSVEGWFSSAPFLGRGGGSFGFVVRLPSLSIAAKGTLLLIE